MALMAPVCLWGQGRWQMAAPLPAAMGEIVGTVVGGKWYVMAGLDPHTRRAMGVVYEFDQATNAWAPRKSMPVPAHHIQAAAFDGKIYVFGGFTSSSSTAAWQPSNRSWRYDPAADRWEPLAPMPTPRGAGAAVALNGKIYVIGGAQANVPGNPMAPFTPGTPQLVLGTVEEYDPAANRWRSRAPMPTPRNHLLAAAANGRIYAIGGRIGSAQITAADDTDIVEEYNAAKDQWANKGRAPIRSSGMAGGEYNGKIYMAGGEFQDWEGAKAIWAVLRYDPASGRWDMLPRMQLAHHGFAAGFLGNHFHVAGGGFQSDGMPGVDTKTAVHEVLELER